MPKTYRTERIARLVSLTILCSVMLTTDARADETARQILGAIFDEDYLVQAAYDVHLQSKAMLGEERYDFLKDWVFPNASHSTLRLSVAFTPTDPTRAAAENATAPTAQREMFGGRLVSPAADLITIAESLGRLGLLQTELETIPPAGSAENQNQLAFRVLILLKQGRTEEGLATLEQFARVVESSPRISDTHTHAEALLMWAGRDVPAFREILADRFHQISHGQRVKRIWTIWNRQSKTLVSPSFDIDQNDTALSRDKQFGSWKSAAALSAKTRGSGIPHSQWKVQSGHAENMISHGDDRLYFNIPLRGDFQVECDFTSFGWTDTEMLVAGAWVSPNYTHTSYDVGDIRHSFQRINIEQRLPKIGERFHSRTVVKDEVATTFINGRPLHTQRLSPDHDPWVAIQSDYMNEGSAFNVRITGNPEIPRTVRMTASSALNGWLPYFEPDLGLVTSHWKQLSTVDHFKDQASPEVLDGGGIFGRRDTLGRVNKDLQSHHEKAVFYHRPMIEDGRIDYEFFYREGELAAHPAIDRLCFLIQPDGVKLHQLTDGRFDRSGLAPDNIIVEEDSQRGPSEMPLVSNAWNQVAVELTGNQVQLTLNDTLVYVRNLESGNQRNFGFFHYADRSELRVRNVLWSGDWPRTLPDVTEQSLATQNTRELDLEASRLPAVFQHDFSVDGLPDETFGISQGLPGVHVIETKDGIQAQREGAEGFMNSTISPRVVVHGDFDITATYDQFESEPAREGNSKLMLNVMVDGGTHTFLQRVHLLDNRDVHSQLMQTCFVEQRDDGELRDYFVALTTEVRSGKLRLARRGSRMFYLYSEGDSPNFELVGSREFVTTPIMANGVALICQSRGPGLSRVVWRNVSVRAERLSGLATIDLNKKIAELNRTRANLPRSVEVNLKSPASDPAQIYEWGDLPVRNTADEGLHIVAEGADNWTSAGFGTMFGAAGDFDLSATFENVTLATPATGKHTQVQVQVELADDRKTQLHALFTRTDAGFSVIQLERRQDDVGGKTRYVTLASQSAKTMSSLRLTRRGSVISVLGRTSPTEPERFVGEVDVSDAAVSRFKILLHTGGANRTSKMLVKSVKIRSAE